MPEVGKAESRRAFCQGSEDWSEVTLKHESKPGSYAMTLGNLERIVVVLLGHEDSPVT